MLLKDLEKLIRLVEKSEIAELELEKNKERVRIRKPEAMAPSVMTYAPHMMHETRAPAAPTAASAAPEAKAENARSKDVLSPFVGTFYSAPAPGAPRYVESGQRVKKGDVLCIIEAMKIMNEIEAEFAGKVTSMLAKDGQPVQYGQPLFQIEP